MSTSGLLATAQHRFCIPSTAAGLCSPVKEQQHTAPKELLPYASMTHFAEELLPSNICTESAQNVGCTDYDTPSNGALPEGHTLSGNKACLLTQVITDTYQPALQVPLQPAQHRHKQAPPDSKPTQQLQLPVLQHAGSIYAAIYN